MITIRSLYNPVPPPYRSIFEDNPTLLTTWWATGCSVFIILARVCGRYVRTMRLFRDDWWMLCSIVPLMIRLGLAHVVLKHGTNNTQTAGLSDEEIRKREVGSGVVLAARVFFAMYIWTQKFCITEFYKRLTTQFWRGTYDVGLRIVRWGLLATFLMVVIATFIECHPFSHYWQVVPDPGPKCREGVVQLLTMGILDAATDVLLVVFPIPAIVYSKMQRKRKFQLLGLFSLSLLVVCVALARIPSTLRRKNIQPFRTLIASLEILAATFAANALVLNSFLRDKGPKRAKFKGHVDSDGSRSGTYNGRRATEAGAAYWGSDEDLVRDVGFGVDLETSTTTGGEPSDLSALRSPQETKFGHYSDKVPINSGITKSNWSFPSDNRRDRRFSSSGHSDLLESPTAQTYELDGISEAGASSTAGKRISFREGLASPSSFPGSQGLFLNDVSGLAR